MNIRKRIWMVEQFSKYLIIDVFENLTYLADGLYYKAQEVFLRVPPRFADDVWKLKTNGYSTEDALNLVREIDTIENGTRFHY